MQLLLNHNMVKELYIREDIMFYSFVCGQQETTIVNSVVVNEERPPGRREHQESIRSSLRLGRHVVRHVLG